MTRHLVLCKQRKSRLRMLSGDQGSKKTVFHLLVEGRYLHGYWIHIEAPIDATLKYLDSFLRRTWLDCCGHLSAFTIEGKTYLSKPAEDEKDMDVQLGEILRSKIRFYHKYDFGTTTELTLRVVSEREEKTRGKSVQVLARNDPPSITCSCGKIATQVCSVCISSCEDWLCDECARKHRCGEESLLPVVNSQRVGMCGYTGQGYKT